MEHGLIADHINAAFGAEANLAFVHWPHANGHCDAVVGHLDTNVTSAGDFQIEITFTPTFGVFSEVLGVENKKVKLFLRFTTQKYGL